MTEERLFDTPHQSPQPRLWEWGKGEWVTVLRLPGYAARKTVTGALAQAPFFPLAGYG